MIICHCCSITDKEIVKSVKDGARTVKDIQCSCLACTDCMICAKSIKEIISKELSVTKERS